LDVLFVDCSQSFVACSLLPHLFGLHTVHSFGSATIFIMSADLSTIANLLQASLDPRQNKQGKSLCKTLIIVMN
jgi:hypothetical protein